MAPQVTKFSSSGQPQSHTNRSDEVASSTSRERVLEAGGLGAAYFKKSGGLGSVVVKGGATSSHNSQSSKHNSIGNLPQHQNFTLQSRQNQATNSSMYRNPSFNPNECDITELVTASGGMGLNDPATGRNSNYNNQTINAKTEPDISPSVLKFELPQSSPPTDIESQKVGLK